MGISFITRLCSITSIWSFHDIAEILFISTVLYFFSRWLATHVSQKLVITMYGYCLLIIAAYALSLPLIFSILVAGAPIACMLLMLMHQDLLQKNFVVAQTIVPARREQSWVEALMQSCMISSAQNKNITIIMQHHDDISPYINNGCMIESRCQKELLLVLLQSSAYNPETFIFMNSNGTVIAINCIFQNMGDKLMRDSSTPLSIWQENAALLSAKTDALALQCDHATSTFSVILRGSLTPKLTAASCTRLIDDYVHDISPSTKGFSHDQRTFTEPTRSNRS